MRISKMKTFFGMVAVIVALGITTGQAGAAPIGDRATLGIRPEHLRVDRHNATLNG